jgi:hypothetical protein
MNCQEYNMRQDEDPSESDAVAFQSTKYFPAKTTGKINIIKKIESDYNISLQFTGNMISGKSFRANMNNPCCNEPVNVFHGITEEAQDIYGVVTQRHAGI